MDTIGVDLHKRESQLCIGHDDGTVEERRIVTSRERFAAVLGERPRARILVEASTESEWVARCLEQLGHEVIVADPNFAPMYATRSRRTKTDRRDARTLMEACRLGAYRAAYRLSDARRHVRAELAVREALVRTRTRYIALAKALVRRDGLRVAASEAHLVAARITALELSDRLAAELQPLFAVLAPINEQIAAADRRIAALTHDDATVALLATAPSIGPITAAAIVATVDDITRFHSAHHFEAFLGLVPSERSSGEKRRIGRITKAGNARSRYLLVEAGWRILRSKSEETAALRQWALVIAGRRGKRIAVVALARRLAGILYAMWRDSRPYDTTQLRMPRLRASA
ncbi:MAG TPA: IS110 family transposase [Gemmatimonadaceae bacterium]|jgi:transposase|nr:IS110 family transposase [Gemmatimonadaceae bacterium]